MASKDSVLGKYRRKPCLSRWLCVSTCEEFKLNYNSNNINISATKYHRFLGIAIFEYYVDCLCKIFNTDFKCLLSFIQLIEFNQFIYNLQSKHQYLQLLYTSNCCVLLRWQWRTLFVRPRIVFSYK